MTAVGMSRMAGLIPIVILGSMFGAQPQGLELLPQIRTHVMETVRRLPNYMCTQLIERAQYDPERWQRTPTCEELTEKSHRKLRLSSSDRLRLDVAVTGTSEIYSWVGENRFDDRGLIGLVGNGPLSTGSFASFLISVFNTSAPIFTFAGSTKLNKRAALQFGFRVPVEKSDLAVQAPGGHWMHSAYEGDFYVDATTFDLVRLVVRASNLPRETKACADVTTLDYGLVQLNAAKFLLPAVTSFRVAYPGAIETENRTAYSSCHEFRGESKLTFDTEEAAVVEAAAKGVPIPLQLPQGIFLTLATTRDIDMTTAAAGDAVPARVVSAVRGSTQDPTIPEGSAATCRLLRVQHFYGPSESLTLALKLETITVRGTPVSLPALLGFKQHFPKRPVTQLSGTPDDHAGIPIDRSAAVFEFAKPKAKFVIKSGLEPTWMTLPKGPATE